MPSIRRTSAALLIASPFLTLIDSVEAQTAPVTVPKVFRDTFSNFGGRHYGPLARTKYFGQSWYRGDSMPRIMPITHLGFRPPQGVSFTARNIRVEFILDNSKNTTGNLSKTYAANLSSRPTVFMRMKTVSLPAVNNHQDPNQPAPWFPGDTPMIYTGPHLLVQTDIQTSSTPTATGYLVDGFNYRLNVYQTGTSCGRSKLVWNQSTTSHSLVVSSAPPSTPVTFHFGLDNGRFSGTPLPLDLGLLGMTNCKLMLDPVLTTTKTTDATGRAILTAPLTLPSSALMVFVQASHPEANANPANYVATNMASTILGRIGLGNYVYSWTSFGPTAQHGPYNSMYGQIMLFK